MYTGVSPSIKNSVFLFLKASGNATLQTKPHTSQEIALEVSVCVVMILAHPVVRVVSIVTCEHAHKHTLGI